MYWVLVWICCLYSPLLANFPDTRGTSAAVVHAETGKVLYAKEIDTPIYPASMTKIATALFILRHYPEVLDRLITIKYEAIASITPQAKKQSGYRSPPHWLETDGVTIQLQHREEITGRDLFFALLICSANDAANALAMACCSSVPAFMKQLNAFLREIGCQSTIFNNPHGLHHPDHYTTARDLTTIMREALKEPFFREVIRTTKHKIPQTNLSPPRTISPTNKLILPSSTYYYPPCLGGKTGTTHHAGKNLILLAEKHQRPIVTIATGYSGPMTDLYQDVIALCEGIFNEPPLRRYLIPPSPAYPFHLGRLGTYTLPLPDGVYYQFYASEGEETRTVHFSPKKLRFPIKEGDLLGHWVFSDVKGEVLYSEPFYTTCALQPSCWQKLRTLGLELLASYQTYTILIVVLMLRPRCQRLRK